MTRCWLEVEGCAVRVGASGLLVGRSPECDLVLKDRRASKRHAFVQLGPSGPELVVLGRNPCWIGERKVHGVAALSDRDRLVFPGLETKVVLEDAGPTQPVRWAIETPGGSLVAVSRTPFAIGSGPDDVLQVEAWPHAAIELHLAQANAFVEAGAAARIDDVKGRIGSLLPIRSGSRVAIGDYGLRLVGELDPGQQETEISEDSTLPDLVGWTSDSRSLDLGFGSRRVELRLSKLRARLVEVLIRPPDGYEVGEWLPDRVTTDAVWPGKDRSRHHLNNLVHRLRQELVGAGVDGFSLVERDRGATRLRLAPGGTVRFAES